MSAPTPPKSRIETKQVRHDYTSDEKISLGADLSRSIAAGRTIQAEADEAKGSYKAKLLSSAARIESLCTQLMNGWELRSVKCLVMFRPLDRKKDYYVVIDEELTEDKPVLTEAMTSEDFQAELVQAEARFECHEEIALFPPAGVSQGILSVGRLDGRWFSALRIRVGDRRMEERLDGEQKSVKKRSDAVATAADRALAWLVETLGKDNARGFVAPIEAAIEAQLEREE